MVFNFEFTEECTSTVFLTFKNRASYIQDGRTATLQVLHFIYFFSTVISTEYFKHAAHLLSWRLFTAQHVSGVFPLNIRSSMTAVAASGFTFASWWQPCCVRGRAGRPDNKQKKLLHQVGDLFELNVRLRYQKFNQEIRDITSEFRIHNSN
jgi:hypothetical protein